MNSKNEFMQAFRVIKRDGADKILDWLENHSDFFTAPASTRFHLAYEGGLCEHSVHVWKRLRRLYSDEIANGQALTPEQEETVAICGLLHDVCKCDVYKKDYRNQKTYDSDKVAAAEPREVKTDENGKYVWESVPCYKFCDEIPYGHGEKSVHIISSFIHLTREEAMAIRWHMGFSDNDFRGGGHNVGNAFEKFPLAVLAHVADLQATYLDESRDNDN